MLYRDAERTYVQVPVDTNAQKSSINLALGLCFFLRNFQQYFSYNLYIVTVSFIGGGNRNAR